ncbi:MAG TPA: protein kinase [Candidatus Saccharimonadales bacterium]|nr:protein kinase [Candidatus Saccharimonadales bacterium]
MTPTSQTHCPRCSTPVPDDSNYCSACGASVTNPDESPTGAGLTVGVDAPAAPGSLAPGKIVGNRYRILATIGMGGMGMVYKALDLELSVPVALKVIRTEYVGNEKILERFKKEITIARKVTHKNVARIYDFGESEGVKYISMEYIEGEDLARIIERDGAIPVDKAISILRQCCAALAEAHAQGVVHRDLKPHNVMLDSRGDVHLMDFGIALSQETRGLTKTGAILGTAEYMSPEQAEGKPTDTRSDVYSLGITFYEALTGTVPFSGDTQWQVIRKHIQERPRPLRKIRAEIPVWLETLVLKCLEKDPDHRYQQVNQIIEDLGREKATRLTVALLPDRRKVGFGLGFLAVALVGAAVTAFFLWPRAGFNAGLGGRFSVAVLPFENLAGRADLDWLRTGFAENLTSDLGQSKLVRVMSRDRLGQILKELGQKPDAVIGGKALHELGDYGGLQAVFSGSYVESGGSLRVNLVARDPASGEVIGSAVVSDKEADVLGMIDKLTVHAKEILNLSEDQIASDQDRQIAQARTSSVEAASLFQKGVDFLSAGQNLEAVEPLEQATRKDPDFALAWARLSQAYRNLGYDDKAREAGETALSRVLKDVDSVPAADRSFIRATHAAAAQDRQEEIEAYTEMVEADPFDPTAAYNLGLAYEKSGQWNQAEAFFRKALELDRNYVSAHMAMGRIEMRSGNPKESLGPLQSALDLYKKIGSQEGEASAYQAICNAHAFLQSWKEALDFCRRSAGIKEAIGDKRGLAATLSTEAHIEQVVGKLDEALADARRALSLVREIGDTDGIAANLTSLASILDDRGELKEALSSREEALTLWRQVADQSSQAEILENMGSTRLQMGDLDGSDADLVASGKLYTSLQIEDGTAQVLSDQGLVALARGDLESADKLLGQSLSRWQAMDYPDGVTETRYRQARAALARGLYGTAVRLASASQEEYEKAGDRLNSARCRLVAGQALLLIGEKDEASRALDKAMDDAKILGNVILLAQLDAARAEAAIARGQTAGAGQLTESLCKRAAGSNLPPLEATCARIEAERSIAQRDPGRAAERASEAAGTARGTGLVLDELEANLVRARALLAAENAGAEKAAEQVVSRASSLGAAGLVVRSVSVAARVPGGTGRSVQQTSALAEKMEAALGPIREDLQPSELKAFLASGIDVEAVRTLAEDLRKKGKGPEADRLEKLLEP